MSARTIRRAVVAVVAAATLAVGGGLGCARRRFPREGVVLGGRRVSARELERGQDAYGRYCRGCHGDDGDGRGPAAGGLRPSPRDFRLGVIEFAAVPSGRLPSDDDLAHAVRHGRGGTAMRAWAVPERELSAIVQYVKTFAPRWRREGAGVRVVPTRDPWTPARERESVRRGEAVYHVVALCTQCHPAYATRAQINADSRELLGVDVAEFREDLYGAVARPTDWGEVILPTDFARQELRGGDAPEDVYRALACGVGGTAMAGWRDVLPEEDLWAMVHYVRSLTALRDTAGAATLRRALSETDAGEAGDEGDAAAR